MARAFPPSLGAASAIINWIDHFFAAGLSLARLCFDLDFNGAADVVLVNFLLMDKSVTCFKLFVSAYRQIQTERVGVFAIPCLIGLSIHLFTIEIHLHINHRSGAKYWISGMAIFVAAGAFMLAVKISEDYAWHSNAIEALLDLFMCLDALLLVINKINQQGGNDNLVRDLLMVLAETLISITLFADYLVQTHRPWDAKIILHLVGSCLAVLMGLGQIGWIAYKAYTRPVFAGEIEQPTRPAVDGDIGGDIEQQMVEAGVEVGEEGGSKTTRILFLVATIEIEMSAGATMEDDDGRTDEGEEVLPDDDFKVVVASPA